MNWVQCSDMGQKRIAAIIQVYPENQIWELKVSFLTEACTYSNELVSVHYYLLHIKATESSTATCALFIRGCRRCDELTSRLLINLFCCRGLN